MNDSIEDYEISSEEEYEFIKEYLSHAENRDQYPVTVLVRLQEEIEDWEEEHA